MKTHWVVETVGSEEHVFLKTKKDTGQIVIRMDKADIERLRQLKGEIDPIDSRVNILSQWTMLFGFISIFPLGFLMAYFADYYLPWLKALAWYREMSDGTRGTFFIAISMLPFLVGAAIFFGIIVPRSAKAKKPLLHEWRCILTSYGIIKVSAQLLNEDGSRDKLSYRYLALPK